MVDDEAFNFEDTTGFVKPSAFAGNRRFLLACFRITEDDEDDDSTGEDRANGNDDEGAVDVNLLGGESFRPLNPRNSVRFSPALLSGDSQTIRK